MSSARTRWVCPSCGDARLGPRTPRMENIVRYCLPCSGAEGKLVKRAAPTLERQRERRAQKAKEKRSAKAAKAAEEKRLRNCLELKDDAGRTVEVEVEREIYRLAKKVGIEGFDLSWRRRSDGYNSGKTWPGWRIHISVGSDSLEDFCSIVAHTLALLGSPMGHDDVWRDEYERICRELWDIRAIYKGAVQQNFYAMDREIIGQLKATSRGDYRKSRAMLPLVGKAM